MKGVHRVSNDRKTWTAAPAAGVKPSVTDAVLGAAAGAVGVWAMDQIGWFMLRSETMETLARDLQARPASDTGPGTGAMEQARAVKAQAVRKPVAEDTLTKATQVSGVSETNRRPRPSAMLFHYALGMAPGALYAVARRSTPLLRLGGGAAYGLAFFAVMDETAAPLVGMASAPGRYPWQAHARGLVAHLVLGITTETLLRCTDRFRTPRIPAFSSGRPPSSTAAGPV